ncbi:hypothetical protein SNEBB_000908 [Seison nebaliae]|nr:hypothetical protein SNEBB_000908 [Seison nebaliae]
MSETNKTSNENVVEKKVCRTKADFQKLLHIRFIEKYNPQHVTTLTEYLSFQFTNDEYDVDANMSLLRFYTYEYKKYRDTVGTSVVVSMILLKALTALPRPDFTLCKFWMAPHWYDNYDVKAVVEYGKLLDECQFIRFWNRHLAIQDIKEEEINEVAKSRYFSDYEIRQDFRSEYDRLCEKNDQLSPKELQEHVQIIKEKYGEVEFDFNPKEPLIHLINRLEQLKSQQAIDQAREEREDEDERWKKLSGKIKNFDDKVRRIVCLSVHRTFRRIREGELKELLGNTCTDAMLKKLYDTYKWNVTLEMKDEEEVRMVNVCQYQETIKSRKMQNNVKIENLSKIFVKGMNQSENVPKSLTTETN